MRALDLGHITTDHPGADARQDQHQNRRQGVDGDRDCLRPFGLARPLRQTAGLVRIHRRQLDPNPVHQRLAPAVADQGHRLADAARPGQLDRGRHQVKPLLIQPLHHGGPAGLLRVAGRQLLHSFDNGRQLGNGVLVQPQILGTRRQHEAPLPGLGLGQQHQHVLGRQTHLLAVIDRVVIGRGPLDHHEGRGVHRHQQQDGQREQRDDGATEGRGAQEGSEGAQGRPNAFHGRNHIRRLRGVQRLTVKSPKPNRRCAGGPWGESHSGSSPPSGRGSVR